MNPSSSFQPRLFVLAAVAAISSSVRRVIAVATLFGCSASSAFAQAAPAKPSEGVNPLVAAVVAKGPAICLRTPATSGLTLSVCPISMVASAMILIAGSLKISGTAVMQHNMAKSPISETRFYLLDYWNCSALPSSGFPKRAMQLNVRDVLENGRRQKVAINPDGSTYAYRIIDPRQFILSTSFDL